MNRAAALPLLSDGRAALLARRLAPHDWLLLFLTLFSLRHRARSPFCFSWPVLALVTSQIVLATMYLRWHYLVDVIAGATLAVLAMHVSRTVTEAEDRRRRRFDLGPTFPPALLETAS